MGCNQSSEQWANHAMANGQGQVKLGKRKTTSIFNKLKQNRLRMFKNIVKKTNKKKGGLKIQILTFYFQEIYSKKTPCHCKSTKLYDPMK